MKNNIVCYRDKTTDKWLTVEEYDKLINERPLPIKKLKHIDVISEKDPYYIFFKEEIQRKLNRQIKMEI